MDVELRAATPADDEFLDQLYADVHAAEFAPLGLPAPALTQLLQMQSRAQRIGYATQYPAAESSIIWAGPYPIGRLYVQQSADALRLIDIALLTAFRGHGIGTKLIRDLCERARNSALPLQLMVRPENPATHLYTRLGFTSTGGDALNTTMQWTAQPTTPTPTAVAATPTHPAAEPGMTSAYFRSMIGKHLTATSENNATSELTLTAVEPLPTRQRDNIDPGDSFAVTFEGPQATPLQQGMHTLTFPKGVTLEIFMGPISEAEGLRVYEAVFNRAAPAN